MKRLFICMIGLVGFVFLSVASAEANMGTKIGTLDFQAAVTNCSKMQNFQKHFQEDVKKQFQSQIDAVQSKKQHIEELEAKLKRDDAVMRDGDKKQLKATIASEKKEFQSLAEDLDKKIQQVRQEKLTPIMEDIKKAIETVAKKQQLDAVLPKAIFIYAGENLDITDAVKSILK